MIFIEKRYSFQPYQTNTWNTSNDWCLLCLVRRWFVDKSVSLHLSIYNMLVCHPVYDKELKCSSTAIMSQLMGRVITKGLDIIFCQNNRKRTQQNCPSLLSKQTTLLRCNTLGKITRLVDVKSPQYSEMICQ